MQGFRLPDLTPLIYLGVFGALCAILLVVGGIGFGIWFAVNHVQIVW